ncbi:aminomethyltransferase [Synechococcus sp. HK05]|uniref:CAF17-like 4Fe-4S cluster assembly/insertion protein YgfZ n=1 Tax=Synechococcus sp. HK05 TaxID=2725975 RepID=UPI001C391A15|nr:aminomethyltransferase [Synechococcus sp. HK05]MBV2352005.1 aminomethyltransferase [Synechococcus sp. HK05]
MSAASPARWSTPISRIRLEGADARRFLHGQSSQAIELAASGACMPTCLISPTGRMRALALVCLDEGGADLLVLEGDGAAVHQALDRVLFPADRVKLGPVEAATLVRWIGAAASELSPALLNPGVDLGAGSEQPAWLQQPGEPLPAWLEALPELSAEAVEQQRLRQGFPAAPGELNDSTNPFELGLAPWVSLNKGCYVGQETLAKLATYDGVKQQLRGWRTSRTGPAAAEACAPGTTLTTAAGERAGVITSALAGSDGIEGLALVRRAALEEPQLLANGSNTEALTLEIQVPAGFVAPPVGAGGQG